MQKNDLNVLIMKLINAYTICTFFEAKDYLSFYL
jgi:hypothetical protein